MRRLRQADARAVFLCDDPGLGKTRQILHAAHELNSQRILIVCPASARSVWDREIREWFPDWAPRILVVRPGTLTNGKPGALAASFHTLLEAPGRILIVTYDTLSLTMNGWSAQLAKYSWDLLVLDEGHYLRNASQRTAAVYGLKGSSAGIQNACDKVIISTGSLTPNHAGELYQHIRVFFPGILTVTRGKQGSNHHIDMRVETEAEFQERFTKFRNTPWGRQIVGSHNQHILREKLGPVVLRRRKHEVLPELEPLITQDVALDVSGSIRRSPAFAEIRQQSAALAGGDDEGLLRRLAHGADGPLATLRRELGEVKVDATAQWVAERLDCGVRKMIVFGWHTRVLAHLHRTLAAYQPVIITGASTPRQRLEAEIAFQTHTNTRVLVGQILACGTAITLTAASEVAIMEPSWVPGENSQAIDRAHRLGQHDSVLASFLFVPGTLDERIMSVFRRKADEVALIHDHQSSGRGHAENTNLQGKDTPHALVTCSGPGNDYH